MGFALEIIKNKKSLNRLEIDSETYNFKTFIKDEIDEINNYNDLFSEIIRENSQDIKYTASDTLNRIESRTYFYEKLCKYVYLLKIIQSGTCNTKIYNLDWIVLLALIRYLKIEKIEFEYERLKVGLYKIGKIIRFPLRIVIKILIEIILFSISNLILSKPERENYDYAFLSFYDYRCNLKGFYKDDYFQPLIDYMLAKGKVVIIFNTLIINERPWNFIKYIKGIFKTISDIEYSRKKVEVKLCCQITSIFDLFISYLKGLLSYNWLKKKVIYKDRDITYLVNLSLLEDYFRCTWDYTYKQYYFFKKLFKQFRVGKIIYPYENHPWEKLMVAARNKSEVSTKLTGFQHSSFSLKSLQYLPGRYERDISIFPDKILTVGNILKDVMGEFGHYRGALVEDGCALRHSYLFNSIKKNKNKNKFTKKIVYAFSSDTKRYSRIIDGLISVFGDSEYTVFLKIHPIVSAGSVINRELPPNIIPAKYMNWEDIFEQIDLLFYDDNSLGIEALKYNVDVVCFGLADQIYNCDRLFYYSGIKFIVNSLEELKQFISDYYEGKIKQNSSSMYKQKYLYQYFLPITNERLEKFF